MRATVHLRHAVERSQAKRTSISFHGILAARSHTSLTCSWSSQRSHSIASSMRVRGLLKAPEVVARAIRQVRKADPEMGEREIIDLLARLDPVWEELFPLEQNRLLKLLVDKLVVSVGGLDLRLRVAGLGALVDELTSNQERSAA
ncbi:MAG: hypothetical protein HQL82_15075 [Magnetococcales bacterium]|nr:hypothetical protein [Magnetococcales bacterium]